MVKEKFFLSKNFLTGVLSSLFGALMLLAFKMEQDSYTLIIFSFLIILGIFMMASSISRTNLPQFSKFSPRELLFITSLFITPFLAKVIGFYISAYLEIVAISLIIAPKRNVKTIVKMLLFALVATTITYLIFTFGLRIRCPRGVLLLV